MPQLDSRPEPTTDERRHRQRPDRIPWNQWTQSRGISGREALESLDGLPWNTHLGFDAGQRSRERGAELLWSVKHKTVFQVEVRLPDGSFLSQLYESPFDRCKGLPGVRVRVIEYALDDPGRPQAAKRYRLATQILDPELAPANELAALYAKRWDVEISIKGVRISQGRPQLVLRSRKPDGVVQELYGFAYVHYAIRWLLHHVALGQGVDPDRLSFTGGLRALRRALSRPGGYSPQELARADR